jgi:DNA-binding NarL/FixJ family response regulator
MRVYVVDDHPVVREGLVAMLDRAGVTVVGHAVSGEVALCELRRTPVDVVIVDDVLEGGMDGTKLVQRLSEEPYSAHCLVLASSDDAADVRELLSAGAISVVSKCADAVTITKAVTTTAVGQPFFDHRALQALVKPVARDHVPNDAFDVRDRLILRCLADGRSNREIATTLQVSPGSVKKYVSNLLRKLGVNHRTSAIAAAAERGLLDVVRAVPQMSTPMDDRKKSGQVATELVASWN